MSRGKPWKLQSFVCYSVSVVTNDALTARSLSESSSFPSCKRHDQIPIRTCNGLSKLPGRANSERLDTADISSVLANLSFSCNGLTCMNTS